MRKDPSSKKAVSSIDAFVGDWNNKKNKISFVLVVSQREPRMKLLCWQQEGRVRPTKDHQSLGSAFEKIFARLCSSLLYYLIIQHIRFNNKYLYLYKSSD